MKRFYILPLIALASVTGAAFAASVNVHVTIGDPGYYGPIDISGYPAPRVVYTEPVIIERTPVYVRQPIYLRVPAWQQHHWSRYCGRYHACNRPVYFVQDTWYSNVYVPEYRYRTYGTGSYAYRNGQTGTYGYHNYGYRNGQPVTTYSNTQSAAAQAEAQKQAKKAAKEQEKVAKEQRKAAEHQAKLDRENTKHQAKLAEEQAKVDRKLAKIDEKHAKGK